MDAPKWVKVMFFVLLAFLAFIASIYLAGFIFLISSKINPLKTNFLTYYKYWYHYHNYLPYQKRLNLSAIFAVILAYGVPIYLYINVTRTKRALHGAARFATPSEIRRSKLLDTNGIIVGKWKNRYLMFGGQQFVLLAAPTRSGKGVGIVIPNLLNYPDSVVVLDIKQENFNLTAGFRKQHRQDIFLFNPFAEDFRTSRYNPLGYVRNDLFRISDLIAIGEVFYPSGGKDTFFDDQARNLFLGIGLYLCETPQLPRTIGEMLRQSSGKGQPIKDYLQGIITERTKSDNPLSMECVDALYRFTSTSDNTLSSILASFNAPLGIWANPIVDAATSENDFDLRDVRKKRMTIYIGITPDHLAEAGRLVNLLFSQLVNLNTKTLPQNNPNLKYNCLLLMDEFTSIGKVGIISKAIAYMAGYNLRLLPIIQSVSQLASVYGHEDARTFITNHAMQILYAPREQKDANEYSEMLGYETVKGKSLSRQIGGGKGGRNESESDQRRALLLPQEIKEIGQWKEIIVLENIKPILCDKIRYFDDPVFQKRLIQAPYVQLLDMDTHQAILQNRSRPMTVSDLENGIDLHKLSLDTSKLQIFSDDNLTLEDSEKLTDAFFNMIDENNEEKISEFSEQSSANNMETKEQEINIIEISKELEDSTNDAKVISAIDNKDIEDQNNFEYSVTDDSPEDNTLILDLSVLDK